MNKVDTGLLFRDLTQLGLPRSHFSLINNDTAYNYNPDRFNFYVNLLDNVSDPNQEVASKVFGILARNRRQHDKIQKNIDGIASAINYLRSVYTKPAKIGEPRNMGELETLKNDLNSELLRMPVVNAEYEFKRNLEELKEPEVALMNDDKMAVAVKRAENAVRRAEDAFVRVNSAANRLKGQTGGTVPGAAPGAAPGAETTLTSDPIKETSGKETSAKAAEAPSIAATPDTQKKMDGFVKIAEDAKKRAIEAAEKAKGSTSSLEALEEAIRAEAAAAEVEKAATEAEEIAPLGSKGGADLGSIIEQIGGSYFSERLTELNKIKDTATTRKEKERLEDDVVLEYKENPLYTPKLEQVSFTDRLVFIAMTYAFRAITLTLLNSAIQTQYVDTFTKAFGYYFGIYSMIFVIWVLIVNMRRQDYIPGLIFYYVNTNYDPTVWWRLIIHLLIQALALPLPVLLTPRYGSKSETDTYEKRENLYNTLSFFTFVLWFITSLAALRI
jgi:hypothetical protein